tara:strand:+ start:1910 stop:2896 length:987 start_codon:yes stop_codon:yes gene_type:complete
MSIERSGPFSRVVATAGYLPSRVVSNDDLAKQLAQSGIATSDEWIFTRSGIRQRCLVSGEENAATMAIEVAKQLLDNAGVSADTLDLILVATSTPAKAMPSTASMVHQALGSSAVPAFDLNAACSGYMYALMVANQWIQSGQAKTAMVIGSDAMSHLIDWTDRSICVLFGDAAAGFLLRADADKGLFSVDVSGNGRYTDMLHARTPCINPSDPSYLMMQGREVYKKAVKVLEKMVNDTLSKHGMSKQAIDWLVPHQANIRIIESTARLLDLPMEQVIVTIDKTANTTAASVPLAFHHGVQDGRIRQGDTVMLEAFGAGFTWGSSLMTY